MKSRMSFENWLSEQDISSVGPESYYAELAWQDGYSNGLLYNEDKTIPLDESFIEDLAQQAYEEAAGFGFSVDSFLRLAKHIAKLAAKPAYNGYEAEPSAWMIFNGEGGYEYCNYYKDMLEYKKSYEKHGWPSDWITPLYQRWED